jgi:hypothetical protein
VTALPTKKSPREGLRPRARLVLCVHLGLLLGSAGLGGCAHVPPYAREDLTRAGMESESEAEEERFRSHVYDAREGAAGGHGSTGGGCGCN